MIRLMVYPLLFAIMVQALAFGLSYWAGYGYTLGVKAAWGEYEEVEP
jgi:hypothetical protein